MVPLGTAMARRAGLVRVICTIGVVLACVRVGMAYDARMDDSVIELRDALVLPAMGRGWRTPIHTDALEARLVDGSWSAPTKGDEVRKLDGSVATWQRANTGDNGWLVGRRGGWALWTVQLEQPAVYLLEARGHSMVFVNGLPRGGDVYAIGLTRLPVALDAGTNTLLFKTSRGRISAKLVPIGDVQANETGSDVFVIKTDRLVPDALVGEAMDAWASVDVVNATAQPIADLAIEARADDGPWTRTEASALGPMTTTKVPFRIVSEPIDSGDSIALAIRLVDGQQVLDRAQFELAVKDPAQLHRRTFQSAIDGSVQYYAVRPARRDPAGPGDAPHELPGLMLTLHGAGVQATGQAAAYTAKSWAHIVAPTNRRPFGFDWEDWGRLDALEVLDLAGRRFAHDPARVVLTGHSMGGHGTWQLGLTMPGRFAAIAPSAGWASFWSYAGVERFDESNPLAAILHRAANPSDTLALAHNAVGLGVYILHGDADDNVPVGQARLMRRTLGTFHPDFAYYEQPGAGHWWGNKCVDWPPLMAFLRRHRQGEPATRDHLAFTTMSPGISATRDWCTIQTQIHPLMPSAIDLTRHRDTGVIAGTTSNVQRLTLDLADFQTDSPRRITLDEHEIEITAHEQTITLQRDQDTWSRARAHESWMKGPMRSGGFKDAFRHRPMLVYGTIGTPQENDWSYAKARFDAETFAYRGNGLLELVADIDFNPASEPDRSVVLYGNADTNAAWAGLVGDGPIAVERGELRIGDRRVQGSDLACLAIRPRAGSEVASVGLVAGTGLAGMRLTTNIPYFLSGAGFPDWLIVDASMLTDGLGGVVGAGFFNAMWQVSDDDQAWRADPR